MAANLDAEELEALQPAPAQAAAPSVAERDFGQPRRLAPEALAEAARRVEGILAEAEQDLSRWLRAPIRLEFEGTAEVDARGIFTEAMDPLAVVRFQVDGQPGWLVWENPAGVAAVERVLGATDADEVEGEGLPRRPLSRIECSVLLRLWTGSLQRLGKTLGLELTDLEAIGERRLAGSALDAESAPDLHRLAIQLEFIGGPLDSRLSIYLPVTPGSKLLPAGARTSAKQLPAHLDRVPLDVSVELGRAELQLEDLLALEPGDVIPLDSLVAKPLGLEVDGRRVADVRLGRAHGRLAARLIDSPRLDGTPPPANPAPPADEADRPR